MSTMDDAVQTFIHESRELLQDMEAALLAMSGGPPDADAVAAVFRAAHTIKGSAGLFGFDRIVQFTHGAESVLDRVRDGSVALDDALLALLLRCADHMRNQIDAVDLGALDVDDALQANGQQLRLSLQAMLGNPAVEVAMEVAVAVDVAAAAGVQPLALPSARAATPDRATPHAGSAPSERGGGDREAFARGPEHWHISLRFGPDVLRNGMDPAAFLRYLGRLGNIENIVTLADALPEFDRFDAESCYLGFEIAFRSDCDKAAIESVFDFVLDDCRLRIVPPHSRLAEYLALLDEQPVGVARLGEMLLKCGTVTQRELDSALAAQSATPDRRQPIGAVLVAQGSVAPAVVDAALGRQQQLRDAKAPERQSVRVDAEKLDRLIDLVGEMVIAVAGSSLAARRSRNVELQECSATLAGLVQRVRDGALQLRMVKIGATLSRFQRVVHDVSRELGKDIRLQLSGEDTELDKTVVERIGDPLVHLVRNAMDHGIEATAVRVAAGKPAFGTLTLNAFHDSGSVVIEVSDDGGGLQRDLIFAKALERGLVQPGHAMSDSEVYALVFEPGFSTAAKVTNLSGRGVGMDVVKRDITALRGTVHIDSRAGIGTRVTVRLPLTLAIIDGFQVAVGDSVFVIPLEAVDECVVHVADAGSRHQYTDLRGRLLPFIRLRELFGLGGPAAVRRNIVVVRHAGNRFGILVDALLGEVKTVIKPLSSLFSQAQGISGSSILASGDVALILDVPALWQMTLGTSTHATSIPHAAVDI